MLLDSKLAIKDSFLFGQEIHYLVAQTKILIILNFC